MAIPMLVPFVLAFPGCQPLLDGLMANYSYWCSAEETANKESAPAGEACCKVHREKHCALCHSPQSMMDISLCWMLALRAGEHL